MVLVKGTSLKTASAVGIGLLIGIMVLVPIKGSKSETYLTHGAQFIEKFSCLITSKWTENMQKHVNHVWCNLDAQYVTWKAFFGEPLWNIGNCFRWVLGQIERDS